MIEVAHAIWHAQQAIRIGKFRFNLLNGLRYATGIRTVMLDQMTFIIEAIKEDHQTADIRSSAIDAVILARKLAADGFAVSIDSPTGHRYSADQFNLLLTSKSVSAQGMADDR
jgi:hypothetical protein